MSTRRVAAGRNSSCQRQMVAPDRDLTLQREIFALATARKAKSPPRRPPCVEQPQPKMIGSEAALADVIEDRRTFIECTNTYEPVALGVSPQKSVPLRFAVECAEYKSTMHRPEEAIRPPVGSGYQYPSYVGRCRTLSAALNQSLQESDNEVPLALLFKSRQKDSDPTGVGSRRERIETLERAVRAHDEEKMQNLAAGTFPLLGPEGEPLPVPVPLELESSIEKQWLKRQRQSGMGRSARSRVGEKLVVDQILGQEARNRTVKEPITPTDKLRARDLPSVATALRSASPSGHAAVRGELTALALCDTEGLLREANEFLLRGAGEGQWDRLATQLTARAYTLDPPDVLRMVRALGAGASGFPKLARVRQNLLRAADHLLSGIATQLQDASPEFLADTLEAMSDVGVGSQVYLDNLMAQLLARHHRDCEALTPSIALRIGTGFGRISAVLQLRPRGVGGPHTSTNMKLMDVLQRRLQECLDGCSAEDLAQLDGYYLTRLCSEETRRVIVTRMAVLKIGYRETTKQYLPLMVRLEQLIRQELSQTFRLSLVREAREYLDQLKNHGLSQSAPWMVGDFSAVMASARVKLTALRALDAVHQA